MFQGTQGTVIAGPVVTGGVPMGTTYPQRYKSLMYLRIIIKESVRPSVNSLENMMINFTVETLFSGLIPLKKKKECVWSTLGFSPLLWMNIIIDGGWADCLWNPNSIFESKSLQATIKPYNGLEIFYSFPVILKCLSFHFSYGQPAPMVQGGAYPPAGAYPAAAAPYAAPVQYPPPAGYPVGSAPPPPSAYPPQPAYNPNNYG